MKKSGVFKVIGLVAIIIIAIIAVYFGLRISAERKAVNAETRVQNYLEDIKVAERNRVDSLQTLADSTKSYTQHVEKVNACIADARRNIEDANFDGVETNFTTAINVIKEAYPNLEASQLYKDFNKEVIICNRDIEKARLNYNKGIRDYDNLLRDPIWGHFISKTGYEKVEFARLSETLGDNQDMPVINWD